MADGLAVAENVRTERWIYRHSPKAPCARKALAVDYHYRLREETAYGLTSFGANRYEYTKQIRVWIGAKPAPVVCPDCGKEFGLGGKPVKGTLNPAVKCGERCRTARRADCECSCDGANHGAGWAVAR